MHWLLVLSGGNCSVQWPISLLIIPSSYLPNFHSLVGSLYLSISRYLGVGIVVSSYHAMITIKVVGTCVIMGGWIKRSMPWLRTTTLAKHGGSNPSLFMYYFVFVLWFMVVLINAIGIAWDVVECEVTLAFWYEHCKQGESRCLGNRLPYGNMLHQWSDPLGDLGLLGKILSWYLVLLVFVWLTLPPWPTLNVNLESVSITIMSKGKDKSKHNIVFKLYYISSRNVCNLGPSNVPSTCKCARFACELEAFSYGSKISNLWVLHPSPSKCWCEVEMPMRFPPRTQANYEKISMIPPNLKFGFRPS